MRYFLTFLIGIGLIVLVIILLLRAIFGGGGGDSPESRAPLIDYANSNVIMRITIQGPINAHQEHARARIDVSQYSSDIRVISGYENFVERSETFESNPSAYANFLRALDLMGYDQGDDSDALADERGVCPFGRRYVFEIIDGSSTIQRYWATSCSGAPRSSNAQVNPVLRLFRAQIPEYNQIVSGTGLN